MVATNKKVCRKCTGMCSCYALATYPAIRVEEQLDYAIKLYMRKHLCVQVFIFSNYIREVIRGEAIMIVKLSIILFSNSHNFTY